MTPRYTIIGIYIFHRQMRLSTLLRTPFEAWRTNGDGWLAVAIRACENVDLEKGFYYQAEPVSCITNVSRPRYSGYEITAPLLSSISTGYASSMS
jgi:hypothetical protein